MTDNNFAQQPDELGTLAESVKEFMERYKSLENEIGLLRIDQKDLKEEFSERLDIKTLNAAMRVVKIEAGVQHKDTYDNMIEVLKEEAL
jgi:uncharacterized protein (UPF0335 family)